MSPSLSRLESSSPLHSIPWHHLVTWPWTLVRTDLKPANETECTCNQLLRSCSLYGISCSATIFVNRSFVVLIVLVIVHRSIHRSQDPKRCFIDSFLPGVLHRAPRSLIQDANVLPFPLHPRKVMLLYRHAVIIRSPLAPLHHRAAIVPSDSW